MAPRLRDFLTRNLTLKLVALVLAILLWAVVRSDSPTRVTLPDVPVEVALRDPGWTLVGSPSPATVTVVVSAPYREMVRLAVGRPRVIVPLERVTDTTEVVVIQPRWVRLNGGADGIRVEDVRPGSVRLAFHPTITRAVPVAPAVEGSLPEGFRLVARPVVEPPVARVTGPARRVEGMDSLRTAPIRLDTITGTATLTVPLDTTGLGGLDVVPREVGVTIRVLRLPPEPEPPVEPDTPAAELEPVPEAERSQQPEEADAQAGPAGPAMDPAALAPPAG